MKKVIAFACALAATGTGVAALAALGDQLQGSDTLETMTDHIVDACSGVAPLVYVGGGSTNGEQAMRDGKQQISPMSRALQADRTCRSTNPGQAENKAVALDGLAVVNADAECVGDGIAHNNSVCFDVTDLNGSGIVDCTDCEAGQNRYCFSNEKDALRIIFAGMMKSAGSTIGNKNCNSDIRHSLAAQWSKLFQSGCAGGSCTELKHAWRRDDLSGTTDTFLSLLGLPAITSTPFCNGAAIEDLDPIRRTCDAADNVCQATGKSGLVLPVFVPEVAPVDAGDEYPAQACQTGKFALAAAQQTNLTGGGVRFDCPEKANFSVAGFCLAPQATNGEFSCLSAKNNPNVFFANLSDDARLFNRWVRKATGAIVKDKANRLELNAFYRVRTAACDEVSSTLNIGCLAANYACTIGFAGREADDNIAGAKSLSIKGVFPTDDSVRKLLLNPVPADVYPLARFLYVNSMVGFENVTESHEAALAGCYGTQTTVDAAAAASGFITLGPSSAPVAPICKDFKESDCNGLAIKCDVDADCGSVGKALCVGGNTATTTFDGTCDQTCASDADCHGGRTCANIVSGVGRCDFTTTTNACL